MELLVLGVTPPTDIDRRARELQRTLYAELGLADALALPVLLPLSLRAATGPLPRPALSAGRLEAPRLVTGPFAIHGEWLLWTIQIPQAPKVLTALREAWRGSKTGLDTPGGPAASATGLLPLGAGIPLAVSASPSLLEAAAAALSAPPAASNHVGETPRTFQPRCLAVYRLRPLDGPGQEPPLLVPTDPTATMSRWGLVFGRGLYWEEIEHRPLRRQRP